MNEAEQAREIYKSDYFIVTLDDRRRLLRRSRTARPFSSLDEAEPAYEALLHVTDTVQRASHFLLVDLRLAPPRNDPGFEKLVVRYTPRLYGGYRRVAVLVKTHAGKLQITRMQGEGYNAQPFLDDAAALAYLLGI